MNLGQIKPELNSGFRVFSLKTVSWIGSIFKNQTQQKWNFAKTDTWPAYPYTGSNSRKNFLFKKYIWQHRVTSSSALEKRVDVSTSVFQGKTSSTKIQD